jgi:hypothetical protein
MIRPVSIALIPVRDRPDRRASSSWDHPLCMRRSRTRFSNEDKFVMIASAYAILVSLSSLQYDSIIDTFVA